MACSLTGGYVIDCRESVGGIQTLWVLEKSNITSYGETDGSLTGITLATTGTKFWKIEVPRGTAFSTNTITASAENGTVYYTHGIDFPINSRSATVQIGRAHV